MRLGCFLTAAAGQVGPLAQGTFVFPETLLSSGCHLQGVAVVGREEPSLETLLPHSLAALPTAAFCGLASQASNALYTEFGRMLPVFDGRCPPSTMPEVFPQPWRGPLTEGWGSWALFPSHSSWSGSLCGHRVLPPSHCCLSDIGADLHVASVGLGELYKH